jgi:hypothetical protein
MHTPSSTISGKTFDNLDRTTQIRLIPHISRLGSDLRGPISREGIRHDLAKAQADGFDPKELYEKALLVKELTGEMRYPAPQYDEVDPNVPMTR